MSASVAQENSIDPLETTFSDENLPKTFSVIHPTFKTDRALPYFRAYLFRMLKDPKSPLKSESSVSTYASCATCWVRRYATGIELQHALSKEFITSTAKDDTKKSVFLRGFPQTRCGLRHFVRLYELCCKQFHPSVKEEDYFKPMVMESKKRKRMVIENTPTLHTKFVDELAEEFIHRFRSSSEGFPTTVVGMKQFLRLFDQFKEERLTEQVWAACGVTKEMLLVNTCEDEL